MALSASTVWEFASGGSMNNGGGYVTTGGSTNYSLSPTPEYSPTTAYHAAGSTTVTVDSGAFTTAMIGNLLKCVSGTNATVGWYEIKTRPDANTITLDRTLNATANTTKDITLNIGGALAYGIAAQDTAFHAAVLAGNTIWYNGGNTSPGTTFTIAGNIAAGTAGGAGTVIFLKGYKLTRGDSCVEAYRPTIACAAFTIAAHNTYCSTQNLIFTGTGASIYTIPATCVLINCKSTNSSTTANQTAFASSNSNSYFIGCEAISPNGYAFAPTFGSTFVGCYAHDSKTGIQMASAGSTILNGVIETCTIGLLLINLSKIVNSTIRNCGTGISAAALADNCFINNIITDCYVGASWSSSLPSNVWAYNCFYGNTTPRTNVTAGATDIATDPALTGVCGKGTDGASVATSLVFTAAAGTPFASVTTSDYLAIFAGTGTGIKLAVYAITSVDSNNQLTLTTDPTNASNNISSCTFGVVKGSDFTLGSTSTCIDAALDAQTYSGVTV